MKVLYVRCVRIARAVLARVGFLRWLEEHRSNRIALWLRSLFAIYDIDDMVRLDVPWWTLASVEKVDRHLRRRQYARVFEYGSGASTVWLSKRADSVDSVEHDDSWGNIVIQQSSSMSNVHLRIVPPQSSDDGVWASSAKAEFKHVNFANYVATISEIGGSFDLIVIDGRSRSACLAAAVDYLAADGLIVFDNTGRRRYRDAIAESGLASLETRGLTMCLPYPDSTTLLAHESSTIEALSD